MDTRHRQLLPQPARKSWKDHDEAQAPWPRLFLWRATTPKGRDGGCGVHTHQQAAAQGSERGTWDVARLSLGQGWATILLWNFSRRAGEQRVHKEREKELTVPWMGAGVKDEAVAMEA